MVAPDLAPSPELADANRRLYELRERVQAGRPEQPCHQRPVPETRSLLAGLPAGLPAHLGWGSPAETQALRQTLEQALKPDSPPRVEMDSCPLPLQGQARRNDKSILPARKTYAGQTPSPSTATVKLYPDIALGMLHKELTAAGRIWLLLRYLDGDGRGWLPIDFIQENLTTKNSDLRVCGRRQLRNLLKQGGGVFWDRDKDKVWLKSAAKVAAALEVERLTGRPVELPLHVLLGGIRQVRAHFYASFHSGRKSANPISRSRLEEITNVPERTQRLYERTAGVTSRPNIAVGRRYTTKEVQEQAWLRGRATFEFIDVDGKQGPAGRRYVAWRLPNSYQGCHEFSPKGRQKKINNRLNHQTDLVTLGAQGNGLDCEDSRQRVDRLFHSNGLEAGKAYNRRNTTDIYWQQGQVRVMEPVTILWHVISKVDWT